VAELPDVRLASFDEVLVLAWVVIVIVEVEDADWVEIESCVAIVEVVEVVPDIMVVAL
jgi:hypothetical protein